MITYLGLIAIIAAWGVYVFQIHNARRLFPAIYALGVLLLVVDALRVGMDTVAWLNLAVLVLVIVAIIKSGWRAQTS